MQINTSAPVAARSEIRIDAPVEIVWAVQADIEGWSRWNPDVAHAELRGPLTAGTEFRKAGGLPITSTLREVVEKQRLVWTGRALSLRAVHVWTFEEQPGEGVRVQTDESFEGLLARLLAGPLQHVLASSPDQGLEALKAECERRARRRTPVNSDWPIVCMRACAHLSFRLIRILQRPAVRYLACLCQAERIKTSLDVDG